MTGQHGGFCRTILSSMPRAGSTYAEAFGRRPAAAAGGIAAAAGITLRKRHNRASSYLESHSNADVCCGHLHGRGDLRALFENPLLFGQCLSFNVTIRQRPPCSRYGVQRVGRKCVFLVPQYGLRPKASSASSARNDHGRSGKSHKSVTRINQRKSLTTTPTDDPQRYGPLRLNRTRWSLTKVDDAFLRLLQFSAPSAPATPRAP